MRFHDQIIGCHMNILMLRSRRKYTKPRDNSQGTKWKRRLNITWNLSITIPTGEIKFILKLISSSSIVNTLTSSCKFLFNGAKTMVLLHPYKN